MKGHSGFKIRGRGVRTLQPGFPFKHFMEEDSSARVLWGIEDNEMGEDAWAKNWDSVCRSMEQTARTVFKDNLKDIF